MSEEEIARALREMDKKEREWLDNHKREIKNINNMVDDLEKDKKVQKVVETFSRWQDPTIEKLQQENKQFKKALLDIKEKEKELLHIGWNYNDLKEILDIVNKALEGNNEDNQ